MFSYFEWVKNSAVNPYTEDKISVLTNILATEMFYEFAILKL